MEKTNIAKRQVLVIINEKTFKIEGNWTILQACEKIGLYIPRFCYNETLSIAGNCRMCLVEIEKTAKLMPACAIQTTNEMKIKTRTNLVKKTRESILEFLLINHPLDCPICDQGGECDLQDQAMIYGSDRGRFYEYKRAMQDKNAGPLIKTIMTRCIHCTRCIRFATEIAGIETYGTTGRGKGMEVGTYIGKIFDSELSGNVIDLCPVGALTSKPYAFKVRPWELKSIETIDILDSVGTNIRVDIRGSEIMRILPRTNGTIKEQWISDKTRFAHDGLKNQRIRYPMIKKEKGYVTISWKEAIKIIGEKIIETKEENISGIIGQFIDQETTKIIKKKFNEKGIERIYLQEPKFNWENIDFREKYLYNVEDKEYETLLIGTNPRREATLLNIRLKRTIGKIGGAITRKIQTKTIGNPINLTYENKQIGKGIETIYRTILGKNKLTKEIIQTINPIAIIGINIIQRKDGRTIEEMLNNTFEKWKKINKIIKKKEEKERNYHNIIKKGRKINTKEIEIINENDNRINILHKYANTPGALEIGIGNNRKIWKKEKKEIIYLIGGDINECQKEEQNQKIFKIYQGHHGNEGAKKANIIIPSTSFIEKKGTYINTEGIIQETQPVLEKEKEVYNDQIIIEKIWNYINEKEKKNDKNKQNIIKKEEIEIIPKEKKKIEKEWIQKIIKKIIKKNIVNGQTLYDNKIEKNLIMGLDQKDKSFMTIGEKLTKEIKPKKLEREIQIKQRNIDINRISWEKNIKEKQKEKNIEIQVNKKYSITYNENINILEDNYYLSDVITKASITMAKCSAMIKTKRNLLNFQK